MIRTDVLKPKVLRGFCEVKGASPALADALRRRGISAVVQFVKPGSRTRLVTAFLTADARLVPENPDLMRAALKEAREREWQVKP